jgi:hypothetical protein
MEPLSDSRPTHVHDRDATTTRCGVKMNSKDRFPYVGTEHVATHVKGYGMVVCPQCAEVGHGH